MIRCDIIILRKSEKGIGMNQNICCLNGFSLKMIAIITMLTDHIGAVLFPEEMVLRYIGRIAFPIFIFLMVEGFSYTRDVRKYEIRMMIFALISEIPFDLAFSETVVDRYNQNVFFTLAIGLVMMDLMERWKGTSWKQICTFITCMALAELLCTDYGAAGIMLIFVFYRFRERSVTKIVLTAIIALVCYGPMEVFCLFAFIPILLYNGKRGPSLKYVFYAFYPVHLVILYLISLSGAVSGPMGVFGGILC